MSDPGGDHPPGGNVEVLAPKAAELIADQLRRQILLGDRAEGELLPPEPTLMTQLGVSRPTLRQALRVLESEQLVRIERGRNGGARVNRPTPAVAGRYLNNLLLFHDANLDDVHRAREFLEPAAVAELAGKLGKKQIAELREAVAASREESDPVRARNLRADFHVRLVELTSNRSLTLFARLLADQLAIPSRRTVATPPAPEIVEEILTDHDRVIDLIEAGASREAVRHWRRHLTSVHDQLQANVDTAAPIELKD